MRRAAIAVALLAALVVVVGAGAVVVGVDRVQGSSMRPSLANGDLVLTNPFQHSPGRFDLVVYVPADGGAPTIKRVIGLPGDQVRIAPTDGVQVQVGATGGWTTVTGADGRPWPPSIAQERACCAADGRTSSDTGAATVPAGSLFVLGDNPSVSIDSRAQGFVPLDRVRSTVVLAPLFGQATPPPTLVG